MYILVQVSYDWYRFQVNRFVSESKDECIKFAEKLKFKLDIYDYTYDSEDGYGDPQDKLEDSETSHYWIEKL